MPPQEAKEMTLTEAAVSALAELQGLVRHAAKAMTYDTAGFSRTVGEAAWLLAGAWATMVVGGVLLSLGLVYGMAVLLPAVPVWAWFAIIGLPTVAVGVVLCVSARQRLASLQPDPVDMEKATEEAGQTAERLVENIESAKASINRGVESMKSTVESLEHAVDLNYQVQQRPWVMVSGAAGLGFIGGAILNSAAGRAKPRPSSNGHRGAGNMGPQQSESQDEPSILDKLGDLLAPQAQIVRDLAVGTLFTIARDFARDGFSTTATKAAQEPADESARTKEGRTPPPNTAKTASTNGAP